MLSLTTIGSFRVAWNDAPVRNVGCGKPAALLVYLAMKPGMHRRETIADLFWPTLESASARLNLRQSLFLLRDVLGEASGRDYILADRLSVGFDASLPHWLDAAEFGAGVPECGPAGLEESEACLRRLRTLVDLYQGPFLTGILLPDCHEFGDWLQITSESLHRHALDLLARLAESYERRGDYRTALPFALRYTELEPWSEAGHGRAIRLYAANGQHESARRQYENCARVLKRELGVLPGPELQALADRIRRHEIGPAVSRVAAVAHTVEERRQVTVMYCELHAVGIDDPEDTMERLLAPQARCREVVRKYSGHVVQNHGGGLLCYFGYPQALENSALSAVRAAREIAAGATPELEIRIGIHSGLIVTGTDPQLPDPVGMTSGAAIHLRKHAQSGEVIVSQETRQRTGGYFNFERIGSRKLRGLPENQGAFRVVGESGATSRLEAARRLTPFTGHGEELTALTAAWEQARRGTFRALMLSGEAGIGKSRLVRALTDRLDGPGVVRELRCFPETRHSPLHPVVALFESLCGFDAGDTPETKLAKLDNLLQLRAPQLAARGLPLLAWMMELPSDLRTRIDAGHLPANLRTATCELLVQLLFNRAGRHPTLLLVEDLHWADESTAELLAGLVASRVQAPLLILLTARPEWTANWPGLEIVKVAPLPPAAVASMVRARHPDLAPERVERIVARAEGIPLFAEELADTPEAVELPANLHALLATRLDGLGSARGMAQLAATIGRTFDLAFLNAVSGLAPHAIGEAVDTLQDAGLVHQSKSGRFQFKHALIQEAAYETQTKSARSLAHRRIAQALEDGYGMIAEHQPEVLARHWAEAGDAAKAVQQWLAAGRHAAARYAHKEAVSHYAASDGQLRNLAPDADRDRLEFDLLIAWARSEQMASGYGGDRSNELLHRATALLGRGAGNTMELFHMLWSRWESSGSGAGHGEATRWARQLLDIAESRNAPVLMQQGHYALGGSLFWKGEPSAARRHFERSIALEEPDGPPTRTVYGHNIPVAARSYLLLSLWLEGRTDEAEAMSAQALALARRYEDPMAQLFALNFAATLCRWQYKVDEAASLAEEGRRLAAECSNHVFETVLAMIAAWAAVMRGDASAIADIERGVEVIRNSFRHILVGVQAILIEALLHVGKAGQALALAEETLHEATARQDAHFRAELHRLKGLALAQLANPDAARECFETAVAISRAQGTIAFELKARDALIHPRFVVPAQAGPQSSQRAGYLPSQV